MTTETTQTSQAPVALTLPADRAQVILSRDNYDLRCTECELTNTKGSAKDSYQHPMLAFTFEICAPTSKKLMGHQEPVEIAGEQLKTWIVLYQQAIDEYTAMGDLDEEQQKSLERWKSLRDNTSYGTLVKLGSIHQSMGLPMEIDFVNIDPSIYIGKTCNAICWSKAATKLGGDDGKTPVTDINGKAVKDVQHQLERFTGPARWPEQHPQF